MGLGSELPRAMGLLRGVPLEELAALPVERVERGPGERFLSEGDPGDSVYGVLTGRVKVSKQARDGRDFCLEVLGPGEVLAAVAVIRRIPMPATAIALERAACLRVPAACFLGLLERHSFVSTRLMDVMARRLVDAGCSQVCLATEPVEVRLAMVLLRMADKFGAPRGGELVFSQSLTRQNLAELAGTTVETAIRVMSRWTRDGLIRSTSGRITILQPDSLRRMVDPPPIRACS
jgi:CRP-like cAMP-binding protein